MDEQPADVEDARTFIPSYRRCLVGYWWKLGRSPVRNVFVAGENQIPPGKMGFHTVVGNSVSGVRFNHDIDGCFDPC